MATKRKGSPLKRKSCPPAKLHQPADLGQVRIYTLAVFLISGQITKRFAKKNPVVSRTIQIRGNQTRTGRTLATLYMRRSILKLLIVS